MSISSSSVSDGGRGMDKLFRVVICGLPFNFFRKASLYHIGRQGCNHWSLAVDIAEVVLFGSDEDSVLLGDAEVESWELIEDEEPNGEWHGKNDEGCGDGLGLTFIEGCAVPLIEIRCVSNLLRHNSACGGGPEMGLWGGFDGLVEWGLVYGQLWWVVLHNLLEG